jgi:D-3-phosphoglycerate dehydrogenase / 2-oxoglutarate reductase
MALVLIAGKIHEAGLTVLRKRSGLVVEEMTDLGPAAFISRLPQADALLIRTALVPAEAVHRSTRLRVVSRHGVGYDNIPIDALTAKGVPLALIGNVNTQSVAEHAMFLMIALAKQGLRLDRAVRNADWQARDRIKGADLAGRTLLLLGFGRIGSATAKFAGSFGLKVSAYDPAVDPAAMASVGVAAVDRDWRSALGAADFVSLHLPKTQETTGMIGAAELDRMKPTAFIVNTSRGGLIDEAALAAAIAGGRLAGAGLDVLDKEPPPADHPLLTLDRVILSPHSASLTEECTERMAISAAENVLAGLDGSLDPSLVANQSVLGINKTA